MSPTEWYNSRIPDILAYVRSATRRAEAMSREQWSVMRYQTACLMRMMQDSKSKPIEPTDIIMFADEAKEAEKNAPPKEISQQQSDKLNAAYEKYLNRKQ